MTVNSVPSCRDLGRPRRRGLAVCRPLVVEEDRSRRLLRRRGHPRDFSSKHNISNSSCLVLPRPFLDLERPRLHPQHPLASNNNHPHPRISHSLPPHLCSPHHCRLVAVRRLQQLLHLDSGEERDSHRRLWRQLQRCLGRRPTPPLLPLHLPARDSLARLLPPPPSLPPHLAPPPRQPLQHRRLRY